MSTNNSQGRWEFDENGNARYVPPEGEGTQPTVDGSYRFSNVNRRPAGENRQTEVRGGQKPSKSDDGWHWALIILGFVAAWPVGLILLFLQLSGKWPGSQKLNTEARRAVNAVRNGAQQIREQTVKSRQQSSTAQPGNYGQTMGDVQERLDREKTRRAEAQAAQAARQAEAREKAQQAEKRRKKNRQEEVDA